jgi:hypothetical protein
MSAPRRGSRRLLTPTEAVDRWVASLAELSEAIPNHVFEAMADEFFLRTMRLVPRQKRREILTAILAAYCTACGRLRKRGRTCVCIVARAEPGVH